MERSLIAALAALAVVAVRPAPVAAQGAGDPPRVAWVDLLLPPDDPPGAAALLEIGPGAALRGPALRATAKNLWLTGRYRSVVITSVPAPAPPGQTGEWVRLTVEALAVRRADRVQVHVDGPLPVSADAIRAAARIAPGDAVDDAELDAAAERVRALLARRGWRRAAVDASLKGDANVSVDLAVHPGAPLRVRAVQVTGDTGGLGEAGLATAPGRVLDEDSLERDVAKLRAALFAAGHRRARVDVPRVVVGADGADVELPVRAGPRMRFRFAGDVVFPPAILERQLGFEPDAPVDAPALDAAVERLLLWYRAHGRADARVEVQERPRGRDLEVAFHVDEGVAYRLAPLRIEGVEDRDPAWVRGRVAGDLAAEQEVPDGHSEAARALATALPGAPPPPAVPGPLAPGAWWDETAFDRAAERVVDVYRAEGWLEALYLGSTLELDRRSGLATVTLRFHEGPRTRVESISFEGNAAVPLDALTREARLAPGDPLAYDRLEETRLALLRLYLSRGYAYARVEAREDQDRDRHLTAVRYVVDEGPQVRIGRIVVTGNRRTQGVVVRGALAVQEGAVYDPEALAKSQAALLRLGVFRSVNVRLRDPDVRAPVKDVAVDLAERPHASLVHGVGFSLANGPRAVVEFTRPNLWGRATELTARGKVNYLLDLGALGPDLSSTKPEDRLEGRLDFGVRTSRLELFGRPAGLRVDAIGEILHRRAYDLRRGSTVTGVDVAVTSSLTTSLQYELEVDDIRRTDFVGQLTQADVERLRFDEGITTLHALRPSFTLDRRDNAAHPHRGWFASGSLEYARSLGEPGDHVLGVLPGSDTHVNMLKLQGTLSGYLPFGKASVVALSLRGGRVFPLDATSRTIIPRRFFLGGSSTMRGYGEELMIQQDVRQVLAEEARFCATSASGVGCTERGRRILAGEQPVSEGGEVFLLGKAEFRLAVSPSLETGFFLDLGNLWLDPNRFQLLDLRPNAGFGLRLVTPVGPAAIDFGFNVWPDRVINERVFALHFTIGLF